MEESIFIEQLPTAALDPSTRWVTAPLRRRMAAFIIDSIIVASIATVLMLPFVPDPFNADVGVWGDATSTSSTADLLLTALGYALQAIVWVIYIARLTLRRGPEHGQTPGKQILRIRAVRTDGAGLDAETAWRRATWLVLALSTTGIVGLLADAAFGTAPHLTNAGDLIASLVAVGMVVTGLESVLRQTFYDRSAGTVVVGAAPAGAPRPVGNVDPLPVEPRPRTWSTWLLGTAAVLIGAWLAASSIWPQLID